MKLFYPAFVFVVLALHYHLVLQRETPTPWVLVLIWAVYMLLFIGFLVGRTLPR